jgi:hypothetical protein
MVLPSYENTSRASTGIVPESAVNSTVASSLVGVVERETDTTSVALDASTTRQTDDPVTLTSARTPLPPIRKPIQQSKKLLRRGHWNLRERCHPRTRRSVHAP